MKTAFYSSPAFFLHEAGPMHPENPRRLVAIHDALEGSGAWEKLEHPHFEAATQADILRCHTSEHFERVQFLAENGGGALDADTIVNPHSFEVALLASGAAICAVKDVCENRFQNAFVASRPPGHHAESGKNPDSAHGFCLFNHIAVAARYAQANLGMEKVAILDFDVHHGNGTQEIFYADPTVFFASLHESPLFPYSGEANEIGAGDTVGTTLNFPLPAGSNSLVYRAVWEKLAAPLHDFAPDLILISAGYDAHKDDPLARMRLEADDFAFFTQSAKGWANELCGGKLVLVLEGGYHLKNLGASVNATIEALM